MVIRPPGKFLMAKILVVGGAGFIGSHTAKKLSKAKHEVFIFDNLSTGFRSLAKYGKLFEGDILDRARLGEVLREVKPDCVMHFAAKALVGESMEKPEFYYENNVMGSMNLLNELRQVNPKACVIFSSTCSLYGITDQPLDENQKLDPINPYARSKKMVEEMMADFSHSYGLRFVSLRYFNAAGCDAEGELGELHEPETHLIPRVMLHSMNPQKYKAAIFGKDYPTPDGTCIRDYVHVEDIADAHILAMDYLAKGGKNEIFNLGSAEGHSVLEVIDAVEKATGKKLHLPVEGRREGDPPRLVAKSAKAEKILGWKPKHNLASIVKTAWAFTEKNRK